MPSDLIRAYPQITGDSLLDTFMVAVSLAVAAIPEGLAAVVTIVLSIGVTNMSHATGRYPPADGGGDARLHTDHLLGQDRYADAEQNDRDRAVSAEDEPLLCTAMALCSDAAPDGRTERRSVSRPNAPSSNDAGEVRPARRPTSKEALARAIGEAPFDSMRKMMSTRAPNTRGGRSACSIPRAPRTRCCAAVRILLEGRTGEDCR